MKNVIALSLLAILLIITSPVWAQAPPPTRPGGNDLVNADFVNTPLPTALDQLLKGKVNYVLSPGLPENQVTVHLANVSLQEALGSILKAVGGITYKIDESGTYIIGPRAADSAQPGENRLRVSSGGTSGEISVDFKDTPLRIALEALFSWTGKKVDYVIEQGVESSATIPLIHATFPDLESALRTILKTVSGVTFRKDENGTYIIARRAEPAPPLEVEPPGGYGPPPGLSSTYGRGLPPRQRSDGPESLFRFEKIPLMYVEASVALSTMPSIAGLESVKSTGRSLLVSGTDEAIAEFKDYLHMVDSTDVFPQAIRVTLDAEFTFTPKNGQPSRYKASTTTTGTEGTALPLILSASTGKTDSVQVAFSLIPTLVENELPLREESGLIRTTYTVSLSGSGRIDLRLPVKSIQFMKTTSVAVSLPDRGKVSIASGSAQFPAGTVQFVVNATAVVQADRVKLGRGAGGPGDSAYSSEAGMGYTTYGAGPPPGGNPRPPAPQAPKPRTVAPKPRK